MLPFMNYWKARIFYSWNGLNQILQNMREIYLKPTEKCRIVEDDTDSSEEFKSTEREVITSPFIYILEGSAMFPFLN